VTDRRPTVESAITAPIEDLNLKGTEIPEALQRAAANPYGINGATSCEAIAAELKGLDAALGADKDQAVIAEGPDMGDRAAGLLRAGVATLIPFRGVVREVTGANGRARRLEETIEVGFARRGFLKGRALEMNCPPPAAPAWFKPAPEPAEPPAPVVAAVPPLAPETVSTATATPVVQPPPAIAEASPEPAAAVPQPVEAPTAAPAGIVAQADRIAP
jgi:hypothetical protein